MNEPTIRSERRGEKGKFSYGHCSADNSSSKWTGAKKAEDEITLNISDPSTEAFVSSGPTQRLESVDNVRILSSTGLRPVYLESSVEKE